ncbi:MAG: TonB-dependent receptor [Ignavibacteriales bacterium]|nr:TonB-dependent receptor [Ignavibacteriales bacterium]
MKKKYLLLIAVLFTVLCVSNDKMLAEPWGITGILEGRILDKANHEPLIGVNVVVVGTAYGGVTDKDGYYQVNNVRAGLYDVRFSIIGYKTLMMRKVTILPDLRTRLDIQLEASAVEFEAVEVKAERPLIQRDQAATAFSIGELKLEKLPLTKFQEVLMLQPGTTLEGNVRGGKTNEVIYLIDGLPVQDVIGGGLGANLPRSSISGLTIHTGGFEAEYGNALSGVVNIVTKGGSNEHKFGARIEKDDWLPERWNEQQDRATELELSASGPLPLQNFYYYAANTVSTSDTRWWQDMRRFFLSPFSQEFTGFGKVEYLPSPTLRLSAQIIYSLKQWHDYEFSWRFNLNGLPKRNRNSYRAALILSNTLSENSFFTVSLSRFYLSSQIGEGSKEDLTLEPYQYDFFLRYVVAGNRNWLADTRQTIYSLKADYTMYFAKMHLIKAGIEFNQYNIFSDVVKYDPQTTYFGKPIEGAALLNYSNSYNYYPRSGSVYLQDKLEIVRDGSNLSFGVRWDFLDPTAERPIVEYIPTSPTEYQQQVTGRVKSKFKHQISPRIAFAGPAGPLSFFFVNVGYYFQFPLFDYLYSGINPAQLRGGAKNVLAGNPDLEPERTISWEAGFKHGINENVVASITYFKKNFTNQIDAKTLIPFDSKAAGDYGFASYVNNAEATATGIEFVLSRERDEKLSGSASYTYMLTEGVSDYVNQQINLAQWGFPLVAKPYPLSWDQRHALKLDAEFQLIGGIQSNLVALYNSPHPYTYYPTRDGFKPADTTKAFTPNNERMENVVIVNLKLTKQFEFGDQNKYKLTVFADGRNILNSKNIRWVDSNGRVGGELSDPSAYYDFRRVRVGVKFEF